MCLAWVTPISLRIVTPTGNELMTGKTHEELFGPTIRGENTVTDEMFEEVTASFFPLIGKEESRSGLKWVQDKTVDEIVEKVTKSKMMNSFINILTGKNFRDVLETPESHSYSFPKRLVCKYNTIVHSLMCCHQ